MRKTKIGGMILAGFLVIVAAASYIVKKEDKKRTEEKEKNMPSAHYERIEDTMIDNEFFSMQVPEELVGKVGYQVNCQETASGDFVISVAFMLDELAETSPVEDDKELVALTDTGIGALYWINWRGIREYETGESSLLGVDFEKLLMETGEVNFEKMDEIGRWEYGLGPEGEPVSFNEDRTGAYCMDHPTDVQYTPETEEDYAICSGLLAEALSTFQAKIFPYDTLDTEPYESLLLSLQTQESDS